MCTGRVIGSPAAMRMEPPLDAPQTDEDSSLSKQALGDLTVDVEYEVGLFDSAHIVGAWFTGEFVEADRFSEKQLSLWREAIGAELQASREESEHAQAWIDSQAGEL